MRDTINRNAAVIEGVAAPVLIDNLDTDQIMPKQFLRTITKDGLDKGVLYDLRFDGDGVPKADFVLNQVDYIDTRILIAGSNFGCGSSREHAVWGLQQFGIEAVIAPSFGEIFFGNAVNNRLLLITLDQDEIDALASDVSEPGGQSLRIDLNNMSIHGANGRVTAFSMSERDKRMIVEGLDMIGMTQQLMPQIAAFEARHHRDHSWMRVLDAS